MKLEKAQKIIAVIKKNLIFYLLGILLIVGIKYFYRGAGSDELRWLLAPTTYLVTLLCGIPLSMSQMQAMRTIACASSLHLPAAVFSSCSSSSPRLFFPLSIGRKKRFAGCLHAPVSLICSQFLSMLCALFWLFIFLLFWKIQSCKVSAVRRSSFTPLLECVFISHPF